MYVNVPVFLNPNGSLGKKMKVGQRVLGIGCREQTQAPICHCYTIPMNHHTPKSFLLNSYFLYLHTFTVFIYRKGISADMIIR